MATGNSSSNIQQEKLNALLKTASEKLGMSQGELKSVLSDKNATDDLLKKIGGANSLKNIIDHPENLQKLINNNPQAKKLLNEILGDKHNG